jgi:hypothetical protein
MESKQQVRSNVRVQVSYVLAVALAVSGVGLAQTQPMPKVPMVANPANADPKAKFQFDKDRRFVQSIKDEKPIAGESDDHDEFDAYNELVLHAAKFPQNELNDAGRLDVSYKDLFSKNRQDYRFELIAFQGRLKRLKKIEPNEYLKDNGIKELYEAWIFPANDSNPMCFLMVEKPAGVEPNEEFNPSYPVKASGFFFKLFEYQSKEPSEKNKGKFLTRRAPFMVSRSMTVGPQDDLDGGGPWREVFLPAVLTFMGFMTAFALGVTWYFRRGDRRSVQILESKKANPFAEGGETAPDKPPE